MSQRNCDMGVSMKRLQFHYHMEIAFSEPVYNHIYTLKCLPRTTGAQKIVECAFHVFPANQIHEGTDSFGNRMLYGMAEEEQSLFCVDVKGRVITGSYSESVDKWDEEILVYKYQTPLTRPDEHIRELIGRCRVEQEQSLQKRVLSYMNAVHERIQYAKGVTGINTTAEEAVALGKGVCQDYAHILIALCREDKIPARYVVGMLMGEGESHAWVEVYDGERWMGFDPTNNVTVEDSHIKISHGRDYRDCSINRGVFTGQAEQKQSILVEVAEA